jgi:hypothetical protein
LGDSVQWRMVAMAFDLTDHGLVAGEPLKCRSPAAAIERAKGLWKVFGHTGAVAFVRTGYPAAYHFSSDSPFWLVTLTKCPFR